MKKKYKEENMNRTVKILLISEIVFAFLFTLSIIFTLLYALFFSSRHYNVGDVGPAGGIVFYVNGQNTDDWTYLEVCPEEYEFSAPWGFYEVAITQTSTDVGSGKKNTDYLVSMTRSEGRDNAAYKCRQLVINGYTDWSLPSKDELALIYSTLYSEGVGALKDDWYWSSSVWDEDDDHEWNTKLCTWVHDFSIGKQITYASHGSRTFVGLVRAIHAF